MNRDFWKDKRVFITGHTGFKGSWLSIYLNYLGAKVKGFALMPNTSPNMFDVCGIENRIVSEIGDIRDYLVLSSSIISFQPEIIIHLAAQPLVRYSYNNAPYTFETNVMGVVNILESAKKCENLKALVNVTSDKCYQNNEWDWGYRENEALGGHDPYSASKACAEIVTNAYRKSFFNQDGFECGVASARAGNVIGGGDWCDDRLIPDIVRSICEGQKVYIRNPNAVRPWQHVIEPLTGYLMLAEHLFNDKEQFSEAWNFGPDSTGAISVANIVEYLRENWSKRYKRVVDWDINKGANPHEANMLKLDSSKARNRIGWKPQWDIEFSLNLMIDWYEAWMNNQPMYEKSLEQIITAIE